MTSILKKCLIGFSIFLIIILIVIIIEVSLLVNELEPRELPKRYTSPTKKEFVSDKLRIPATVYRTWKSLKVERGLLEQCHDKWIKLNPDYDMIWFDDQDCLKTFDELPRKKDLYKAWNMLNSGAFRADLWRYCQLYQYGGIYVDSFATPFVSIDTMMEGLEECTFVSAKDSVGIHNGFMACTPKHPFMKAAIDECLENILNRKYTDSCLGVTGPLMLRRVVNKCLERDIDSPIDKGFDGYGDLKFYLFLHQDTFHQSVFKGKTKILNKKYSFRIVLYRKFIVKNSSVYPEMWRARNIYKQTVL
jgi:hypothetical protein